MPGGFLRLFPDCSILREHQGRLFVLFAWWQASKRVRSRPSYFLNSPFVRQPLIDLCLSRYERRCRMSPVDIALVQAYLSNMRLALHNLDVPCAESFLEHAQELLAQPQAPLSLSMQIDVGVGLDAGIRRRGAPNQDFVFATTGYTAQTQETYGLFVVADGMGGHAKGQDASRLATKTIVDALFPLVQSGRVQGMELGNVLVDAASQANTAIYERNQDAAS